MRNQNVVDILRNQHVVDIMRNPNVVDIMRNQNVASQSLAHSADISWTPHTDTRSIVGVSITRTSSGSAKSMKNKLFLFTDLKIERIKLNFPGLPYGYCLALGLV